LNSLGNETHELTEDEAECLHCAFILYISCKKRPSPIQNLNMEWTWPGMCSPYVCTLRMDSGSLRTHWTTSFFYSLINSWKQRGGG